jgi:Flp pilus assembly pilin Flp
MPGGPGSADSWWWKGGASMSALKDLFARLSEQRGQTMAEYAVVLAVITVVIIASLQALSGGIGAALDSVTGILP